MSLDIFFYGPKEFLYQRGALHHDLKSRSMILHLASLLSGLEKMHPQQIAYIIYGNSSIFGM